MQLLEKSGLLNSIGSYSNGFRGTLTEYSFSKQKDEFVRELGEFPFAIGAVLHANIPHDKGAHTSFIANFAERIIGEWLKSQAEYSFQPLAEYIYKSDSGHDMRISAKAHDFTLLDEGLILNVEVKFITQSGASRRTHRFRSGTEQLQATTEMMQILSREADSESKALKPQNIILVIRKKGDVPQNNNGGAKSRANRIYQNLLQTAQDGNEKVLIPRIIVSYQDLAKIFKSLYPDHRPAKDFKATEECFNELRSFLAKNT